MVHAAAGLALRLLPRRVCGTMLATAGLLLVLLGFFVDLGGRGGAGAAALPGPARALPFDGELRLRLGGGDTAAEVLRHAADHGLAGGLTASVADLALRGGVGLMAAAGLGALLLLPTPLRGLVGTAAGLGLAGTLLAAAVIVDRGGGLGSGPFHAAAGGGGLLLGAAGFAAVLAGGAVAAARPLAGLISGVLLGVGGGVLAALVAVSLGGARLAAG